MLYKKITVELIVLADEAEAVVAGLNAAFDQLQHSVVAIGELKRRIGETRQAFDLRQEAGRVAHDNVLVKRRTDATGGINSLITGALTAR